MFHHNASCPPVTCSGVPSAWSLVKVLTAKMQTTLAHSGKAPMPCKPHGHARSIQALSSHGDEDPNASQPQDHHLYLQDS